MEFIKKSWILVFCLPILSFFIQGCTSSTSSTTSGGTSGNLQEKLKVEPAATSIQASQVIKGSFGDSYVWSSTLITVTVKENNGNPPPVGTTVNIFCGAGFLGEIPDPSSSQSSYVGYTDSIGKVQVKYTAGFSTGLASISASALGYTGNAIIRITASE